MRNIFASDLQDSILVVTFGKKIMSFKTSISLWQLRFINIEFFPYNSPSVQNKWKTGSPYTGFFISNTTNPYSGKFRSVFFFTKVLIFSPKRLKKLRTQNDGICKKIAKFYENVFDLILMHFLLFSLRHLFDIYKGVMQCYLFTLL